MRSVIALYAQLWAGQENLPIDQFAGAGASAFKVEGDWAHVLYATQRFPNRVVVGRDFAQLEAEHERNGDKPSAAFAEIYFKKHKAFFKQASDAYWEIWPNEPQVDYEKLPDLNGYWVRMAQLFYENGLKLAGPSLSAETRMWEPDPNDPSHKPKIEYLRPAMRLFKKFAFLFDVHGYFPFLNADRLPPSWPDDFRQAMIAAIPDYLYPHRKIALMLGDDMPNVFYGEFGADANKVNNLIFCGWRDVPGLDYDLYLKQLEEADKALAADPLVTGAAVYLWCKTTDAEPDKAAYDVSSKGRNDPASISDGLVQYVWAHPGADYIPGPALPPVTPPPVEPPPAPNFPAWYRVYTKGSRLRKRLAPSTSGEIVELQADGSEILVESIDMNNWAKEKGAGLYASADYLVRK